MTDETAVTVALIGLAGVLLAAVAGFGGAILGSVIGARAARSAAQLAREQAEAERAEERRARFADRIRDLSARVIMLADKYPPVVVTQVRQRTSDMGRLTLPDVDLAFLISRASCVSYCGPAKRLRRSQRSSPR